MDDLAERLILAKTDNKIMDDLILDYLPFIKKEVSKMGSLGLDYSDRLSLGLFTFMKCVRQYDPAKGHFFSYVGVAIRNSLRDEGKKQATSEKLVVLYPQGDAFDPYAPPGMREDVLAYQAYTRSTTQANLAEEVEQFNEDLARHDITFRELSAISPRQKRSRKLCLALAKAVIGDEEMHGRFCRTGRLPQAQLAARMAISIKTIEKYRRYIVALVIILSGDYPAIRAFVLDD